MILACVVFVAFAFALAFYHCAGDGLVCFNFFVFVVASVFAKVALHSHLYSLVLAFVAFVAFACVLAFCSCIGFCISRIAFALILVLAFVIVVAFAFALAFALPMGFASAFTVAFA